MDRMVLIFVLARNNFNRKHQAILCPIYGLANLKRLFIKGPSNVSFNGFMILVDRTSKGRFRKKQALTSPNQGKNLTVLLLDIKKVEM